jgi:hypothetical protein
MHGDRVRVLHVLNSPPPGWTGGAGFITRDMIAKELPAPSEGRGRAPGPSLAWKTLRCALSRLGGPGPACSRAPVPVV